MSQKQRILKYLQDYGSITQLEALQNLGIMRLASRMSELKKEGYCITKEIVSAKNRYGETVWFARYKMEVEK